MMKKISKKTSPILSETILVKPLSVNQAWKGRKYKTKEYTLYEKKVLALLDDIYLEPSDRMFLQIDVYYSNKASDIDNCIKPFVDILQKKYNFDDKCIYKLLINKHIAPKGQEKISFLLTPLA